MKFLLMNHFQPSEKEVTKLKTKEISKHPATKQTTPKQTPTDISPSHRLGIDEDSESDKTQKSEVYLG